eukprot:s837_g23.t1
MELVQDDVAVATLADLEVVLNGTCQATILENLKSWCGSAHPPDAPEVLSQEALQKLQNLLLEAVRRSAWDDALLAACALEACCNLDSGILTTFQADFSKMAPLHQSLMLALSSFGEMLEDMMAPGVSSTASTKCSSPEEHVELCRQTLADLIISLCSLHTCALDSDTGASDASKRLADRLLPSLAGALLCAAATSPGPKLYDSASAKLAFHVLQARRRLVDLLNSLLEEASQHLRVQQEQQLLLLEPGASRLVETLCLARPEPKLHEMLLETLWRALRRQDDSQGAAQGSALALLGELCGAQMTQQLRHQVSGDQIKDWGLDLCLQISTRRFDVLGLEDVEVTWGGLEAELCSVTFSSHSLLVVGIVASEVNQGSFAFEVPWVFVQNADAVIARGFPLRFPVLVDSLRQCGALEPALADVVSLDEAVLQIHCARDADESQLKETFEDLNKLFQGLQDSQAASPPTESFNETFVTPTKIRPAVEEEVIWTPPPSQNLQTDETVAEKTSPPERGPLRLSQMSALGEAEKIMDKASQDADICAVLML